MVTRRSSEQALVAQTGEVIEPAQQLQVSEDSSESEETALINVLEQLGETGEGAKVMVYRITDDKRKPDSFLRRFTPAEFAADGLETLLRMYGGGLYKISVYGSNGRLLKNPVISIEAPPGYKTEGEKPNTSDQVSVANQVAAAVTQALAPMLSQLAQVATQPKESRTDFLREMVQMRELFAPAAVSPVDPMAGANLFMEGLKFAKEIVPREGASNETDVLMGLIDKFGGPIAEAVMKGNALAHVPETTAPAHALPAPVQAPVQTQSGGNDQMTMILKSSIGFLVSCAERNNDPMTYAYMVLDQIDEGTVSAFIDRPDWLEWLAGFNPKVKVHVEWFNQLRDAIKSELALLGESGDNSGSMSNANGNDAVTGNAH